VVAVVTRHHDVEHVAPGPFLAACAGDPVALLVHTGPNVRGTLVGSSGDPEHPDLTVDTDNGRRTVPLENVLRVKLHFGPKETP
jgi:hypothetical protein